MNETTNNEQDNQEENATTPSAVTIDLDALDSTKALGKGKLIFYDECRRMVEKIRQKATHNLEKDHRDTNDKSDVDTKNAPSCFFIDGPRGSGKSTLLRAIRNTVASDKLNTNKNPNVQIFPLADVDPTELGKGENFFVYLLGKVYSQLQDKIKQSNGRDVLLDKIRTALNTIRDMSGGLQMLMDSEEVLKKNDTPEFFMENCLDKCSDSTKMREKFSSLIDTLADILNTDVFMVTIDDADLNFSKCEDILEYIRKYMHSPRLIFLFAGDMQLYSEIVRGMHLKNFHEKELKYDTSHKNNRKKLLNNTEDQYLLKLFPVDNREHITTLRGVVDMNQRVSIAFTNEKKEKETLSIQKALKKYITIKIESSFIETILRLPLRSVLFLLRYLVKNPHIGNQDEANLYTLKGLKDVSQQSLIDYNINFNHPSSDNIAILQENILTYYAREKLWNSDLSIRPNLTSLESQKVALYLGASVNLYTTSISSKLMYWYACFPLWQKLRETYLYHQNQQLLQGLLESSLRQTMGQRNSSWANIACTAMAQNPNDDILYGRGTICILNEDCPQNNEIGQDERKGYRTLAKELLNNKNISSPNDQLFIMGINSSLCRIDDRNGSNFYISLYHLLMQIAGWLRIGQKALTLLSFENRLKKQTSQILKAAIGRKLSEQCVTPHTPRIWQFHTTGPDTKATHTLNGSNKMQSDGDISHIIERIPHVYTGVDDDTIVNQMYEWIMKFCKISYTTTSVDFYNAWETFLAECAQKNTKYSSEYYTEKSTPQAASILDDYMESAETAMKQLHNGSGMNVYQCITSCPIWKAVRNNIKEESQLASVLNRANIGRYINLNNKEKISKLQREIKALLYNINQLEDSLNKSNDKKASAQKDLDYIEQKKDETEIEIRLIENKISENNIAEKEKSDHIYKTSFEEEATAQNIVSLQKQEKEIRSSISELSLRIIRHEHIRNRNPQNLPECNAIVKDIHHHEALLKRAKTEETKRMHHDLIADRNKQLEKLLDKMLNQISETGNADLLAERDTQFAKLKEISSKISNAKIKNRLAIRNRLKAEKELAELQDDNDTYRKKLLAAQVNSEILQLKLQKMNNRLREINSSNINLRQHIDSLNIEYMTKNEEYMRLNVTSHL